MSSEAEQVPIVDNVSQHRFEVTIDGQVAFVEYQKSEGQIAYTHTLVPGPLEGRGIAGRLAKHGLDYARTNGLAVVPQCPYVRSYIKRHPDYHDLVKDPAYLEG